ncbi:MAG: RNA polymerase sigma factor [Candidatus Krumholzibacteriia bacterium]
MGYNGPEGEWTRQTKDLHPVSPHLSAPEKLRFEAEIVPHLDVLYRMARSVCCDADVADDVAQDAFLKAVRGFGGLAPGSNSRSWLARIVQNTCRDHWRSRARKGEAGWDDDLVEEAETAGAQVDWQPAIIREAYDDEIEQALRELPPRWRMSVQLVDVEGWSYDEAAEGLGIGPGTLRSGLHRARKVLYGKLLATAGRRIEQGTESRE